MTIQELLDRTAARKAAGVDQTYPAHEKRESPPLGVRMPERIVLPCVHAGDEAGPEGWHVCDHPDEPLGMIVCKCKGCGPRCLGFTSS